MSSLQVGRLQIGPAWVWHEAVGDPVTNLGGAVIPAPRQALRHMIEIGTVAMDGDTDTLAERMRIRRQMRSMLNNTPLKLQGYLYVVYSDDPEQNGWYVPDFGSLGDLEGSSGLATGVWKLEQVAWLMAGHKRINREARNIWMKDLRLGLAWRDQLKAVYSTAFTGVGGAIMQALQLSYLPSGATATSLSANASTVPVMGTLPAGRDGGICSIVTGLADLSCISFERPDLSMGMSDVIVYDRRGNQTAPFYQATVLSDNPVAYWRLDETSGTVATDQIGNYPGTYTGSHVKNQTGALVGGSDNNASVNLTGGWIDVGKGLNRSMSAISVECWVKPSATGSVESLIGNWVSSGSLGFLLQLGNTGSPGWRLGSSTLMGATMSPTTGTWHHIVGTWDGSIMCLYIDGVLAASQAFSGSMGVSPSSTQIGAESSLNPLPGNIDEVAVYQYPLLPKQVSDHYAAGTSYDGGNQWEEVLGPDYSWSWVDRGLVNDTPVMSNGLCRVRYDSSNAPGLKVDVWQSDGALNGGAGWVEQGKMVFKRIGDSVTTLDDIFVSATLMEWTPDRAVMQLVMRNTTDLYSRERIYITMDRGVIGCTIECYPAQQSNGLPADIALHYDPAPNAGVVDLNNSVAKIDSQGTGNWTPGAVNTAVLAATAGSGAGPGNSGVFSLGTLSLGNGHFITSENWVALLRCPTVFDGIGPYQTHFVVLQDTSIKFSYEGETNTIYGLGVTSNNFHLNSLGNYGYLQTQISYSRTQPQQIMEAESMTLGTGTTSPADSTASGGNMTTATRSADAIHVSQANWPNAGAGAGIYRIFAKVKSTATTSCSFYAKTAQTTGATVTIGTSSTPVWQWIDLGEITTSNSTLEIHAWRTGASGSVQVDRIEAVFVQDRTRLTAIYSGARDAGQSALFDSRQLGAVVART